MVYFIGWLYTQIFRTRHFNLSFIPLIVIASGIVTNLLGWNAPAAPAVSPGLQLQLYRQLTGLPPRVVQVNLDQYQSISQYHWVIASPDYGNFGPNACGFLSVAQAIVQGDEAVSGTFGPAGTLQGFEAVYAWMNRLRANAVNADGFPTYQPSTGIQPTDLLDAVRASGVSAVAENQWSLVKLYRALANGQVVIVDIQINQAAEIPSTQPETYAHFARVLGIDVNQQQIYIENTLSQNEGSYWTLSFDDFLKIWQYPEVQATLKPSQVDPSIQEEPVNHWALVFSR